MLVPRPEPNASASSAGCREEALVQRWPQIAARRGLERRKIASKSSAEWSTLRSMSALTCNISVQWPLQVHFTRRAFDPENLLLREVLSADRPSGVHRALVILDESLARAQPELSETIGSYFAVFSTVIELACPPLVMEGGERVKNSFFHVSEVHSPIERYHIDRHSYVIAVGGGALLDMVGLAAATAHRGVRHVRIPTTTLSQADSGVGVKNAINAFGKKNFIGTFAPPFAVINDFDLLTTLAPRDKRAGYVEAVKVACIRDHEFFDLIERDAAALRDFEPAAMQRLIRRCAELHLNHIATSGDPFETGSARPLDFGHWAAHKLEQCTDYRIRHGEAVAIGIALDVVYSRRLGYLSPAAAERVLRLLEKLGFELFTNELTHVNSTGQFIILQGLEEFREHLGGQLTITLLRDIGHGFEVHDMNAAVVLEAIRELNDRHQDQPRRIVPAFA
jgi:3-dehydroquinate synthase